MSEHQKGADGARPAVAAQPDQQTAEQQKLAAGPAAGVVAAEPPEDEKYTVHVPEGLTYFDLDLIKLTAQFVARNGKGFLTGAACFCSCSCMTSPDMCHNHPQQRSDFVGMHLHDSQRIANSHQQLDALEHASQNPSFTLLCMVHNK